MKVARKLLIDQLTLAVNALVLSQSRNKQAKVGSGAWRMDGQDDEDDESDNHQGGGAGGREADLSMIEGGTRGVEDGKGVKRSAMEAKRKGDGNTQSAKRARNNISPVSSSAHALSER